MEEDLQVFVISRKDGVDREWGEQDIDDSQRGWCNPSLGSKVVDDSGIELVCVRGVEVKAAAMLELFGTQGTLVEVACGVGQEDVVLEVAVTGRGEGAARAVKRWQDRRHALVGKRE